MDAPSLTTDFAEARTLMVDGQVRPNQVNDPRILDAMRTLKRERFVPPDLSARAYSDEDVPLPRGRALMEPMVIGRLVQMLALRPEERVLLVAAGSGYGAALLAACRAEVIALEEDADLLALARSVLPGAAPTVRLVQGPLAMGWPDGAPYDAMLIEGAVEEVPAALAAQLRPAGRLATVRRLGPGPGPGQAVLGERVGEAVTLRPQFDCSTPLLAAFRRPPAFVF